MPEPRYRSRLVKQESKRLMKQTLAIVVGTIAFIILFFTVGLPALMRLAVIMGNAKTTSKFNVEDTLAPLAPQMLPLPIATTSAVLSVDGYSEAGSIVTLEKNGSKVDENTTDNNGNFYFPNIILDTGNNNFTAYATDLAGNKSPLSSPQSIAYDTTAPSLDIVSPEDGTKYFGTLNQMVDVAGNTKPGSTLTLNNRSIIVTSDGAFSTKYQLSDGDNHLVLIVTDRAGNQTTKELNVYFSK